jgi:hypothetical protein
MKTYHSRTVSVFLLLILGTFITSTPVSAQSPKLYHTSFETLDFLEDDILEHADWRSAESRKMALIDGRFGKALNLGNVPEPYDLGNASSLGMNMYSLLIRMRTYRGPNWSGPFIWSGDKINPSSGSVSFWIHGKLTPQWKLFYQTTSSFGRVERDLIVVRLDRESRLSGYLVDARYDRHEIVSDRAVEGDGWKHIVLTWDMASGLALFLNGERVASSVGDDAWWMNLAPGILHLPSGGCTYDELFIFDRPLTEHEVNDLYSSNQPPQNAASLTDSDTDQRARIAEKAGISTDLNLPVAVPSHDGSTVLFEDLWNDKASDGHVPGWWVNDGRYVLAWPHPYAFWTITIGDMDFHAEKVDIGIPSGKTVNYITVEGNLEGVKVHAIEDDRGIDTKTLLEVPADHGFFYGSLVSPTTGKTLRIPFIQGRGTPFHYKGDVQLPLTGETRLHEVGLFNVRDALQPTGTIRYLTSDTPELDTARYGFALQSLGNARDSQRVGLTEDMPDREGDFIDIGDFRRLNIFSDPCRENQGIASLCLNLHIRTHEATDVLLVRLRDPAVPSRIWSHAEIQLQGFTDEPRELSLTLDMTDLVLAESDRLWIDICSASGAEVLIGDDRNPSHMIIEPIPVETALAEYARKELYAATGEFSASNEYPLHMGNVHTDFMTPQAWSGIFDKVYPVAALRRVDPDNSIARYLWNFASGKYYYTRLRNPDTGGYYTAEDYPESLMKRIDIPDGVPAWAAWMREFRKMKHEYSSHWINHQNPDGQFGGGYNDDTMHLMRSEFESVLDNNRKLLDAINLCLKGFDKTGLYQDGYQVLYPMDRHHTRDPVRQYQRIIAMNLGAVHEMERAMEVGRHHGHPERTPMHYSEGIPFEASYTAIQWYWGLDNPDKPYIGPDEEKLVRDLRYWLSSNDSTLFWYETRSYKEIGGGLIGNQDFFPLFLGCAEGAYPHLTHAVSWPKGGGLKVSRWIEYADDTTLHARIFSFDDMERVLTARLYRLEAGRYSLTLAPDRNNDGIPDDTPDGEIVEIRRFSDIELTLPPHVPMLLHIRQIERYDDPGPLPDLAVDPEDIRVNGTFITVTLHNIGNAPARNVAVTLMADGMPVETKIADHVEAPVDYVPKSYTLYFNYKSDGEKIEAVLDPDNEIREIFELNNSTVAEDYRGSDYFDWSDVPYVP